MRLDHEQAWQNAAAKVELPLHIFRLAGKSRANAAVSDVMLFKTQDTGVALSQHQACRLASCVTRTQLW